MQAPRLDACILPQLDFVLISHNHYDHLDSGTVGQLNKLYGNGPTWFVCAAALSGCLSSEKGIIWSQQALCC